MTPEQRVEMEARVDRAVRRGELSQARADLVTLLEAFPDDARLQRRLEAFESAALPGELRPTRPAPTTTPTPVSPERPEALAERMVQEGDLRGALAAYRRAVEEHPGNELLRERLTELFEQVRTGAAAGPAHTEALPSTVAPQAAPASPTLAEAPSTAASMPAPSPSTPEPAVAASEVPGRAPPDPDPVARLERLLERLQSRRRSA